jgi:capsular exopolysaccharide synthesis family protein
LEEILELRDYLALFRRRWWLVILLVLVGGAGAFSLKQLSDPVYEAATTILINQAPGSLPDADAVLQGQRVAYTYAELLHQRPVLEQVILNLGLDIDPDTLERDISVTPIRDTNLLELTVENTDPQLAADIANEIVRVFVQQNVEYQASRYAASLANLETELGRAQNDITEAEASLQALANATTQEELDERNRLQGLLAEYRRSYATLLQSYEEIRLAEAQTTDMVTVVEYALSGREAGYSTLIVVLFGVVLGGMAGVGITFLLENLRDTVTSPEEVEQLTGVSTLGVIGVIQVSTPADALVTVTRPRSSIAEAYRVLRANVEFSAINEPIRTVMVTSGTPSEGKTTTVANLATAFAQAGKRTILVDTDLRHPMLHKLFQQTNRRGVTTALAEGGISNHLVPTGMKNMYLMPSGPLPPNPAELLSTPRMAQLIEVLKAHADIVFFDSPPVLAVADATILTRACDATLLVVHTNNTRIGTLIRAKDQIAQSGGHLMGTVLNRMSTSGDGYYYYYHKYYGSERE